MAEECMTQSDKLLELFIFHGYKLRLGDLLKRSDGLGYKCTSRFSDLRRKGYHIEFHRGDIPSNNTWTLRPPSENGQEVLGI